MMFPPILIVLYEPTEAIINRIRELETYCKFYIFDNSSNIKNNNWKFARYHHSSSNIGIAGALKWMIKECQTLQLSCFLFFDQDTVFSLKTIESITQNIPNISSQTAIVHFSSEDKKKGTVRFVINSGTLFFTKPLEKIESILDKYFVDAVDLAICHHVRKNKYNILSHTAPDIDHVVEQGLRKWRIFGFEFLGKVYDTSRRRDFFRSHSRLMFDCFRFFCIVDSLILIKFMMCYLLHQFKCEVLNIIAAEV